MACSISSCACDCAAASAAASLFVAAWSKIAIAIAANKWGMSSAEIANEYDIPETQIKEAQAFYQAHRVEIDAAIEAEEALAPK